LKITQYLISFLLVIGTTNVFANYYDNATKQEFENGNLEGQELRSLIRKASSKNFRPLGYKKRAKNVLFGDVDLQKDDQGYFVYDVYCRKVIRNDGGRNHIGPNRIPKNEVMNTEHTWPQSKGSKREPMRGDLHHLYPTDSRANSTRGNLPFAEVEGRDAHSSCSASQKGKAIDPKTKKVTGTWAFEPPHEHKGNVARAMFYFATKYNFEISPLQEAYFKKWNKEDPVDAQEIQRNDEIAASKQGNRNPYIDFPHIINRISDL